MTSSPPTTLVGMTEYAPEDVTAEAKRIAAELPTGRDAESERPFTLTRGRRPVPSSIDASRAAGRSRSRPAAATRFFSATRPSTYESNSSSIRVKRTRPDRHAPGDETFFGLDEPRRYDGPSGNVIRRRASRRPRVVFTPGRTPGEHPGNFARPRRFEVAAGLNRLRSVEMEPAS